MKKILLSIFLVCAAVVAQAVPNITEGAKYRLVCSLYPGGCVTVGADYNQRTPLYYLPTATNAVDNFWILAKQEDGSFSIQNAATKQFVTYDGERIEDYKRYVKLTATDEGVFSHWRFNSLGNNVFEIRCVGMDSHLWDVRANSMIVGTYASGSANTNQRFVIKDEVGNEVKDLVDNTQFLPKATPLEEGLQDLLLDGRGMPYDTRYEQYMYSVQEDAMNKDLPVKVTYTKKEGWSDLTINNTFVTNGSNYTFANIAGEKTYTLKMSKLDGSKTISAKLTFTSLPVVELCGNFGYDYTGGYVRVFESDNTELPELINSRLKWRGGITNNSDKHKRNYNIKLYDETGEKSDHKFFGLRKDNRWILDAGQVDMSRVRNRVLTELWESFCTKPYYSENEPKALSCVRGQMVEVTLNGSYQGVYHMTERLDRKQMKLMKYDEETQEHHGLLWKGKDWSYGVFMGHYSDNTNYPRTKPSTPNGYSENWENYIVEYPDIEDVFPTDWSTLYDAVELIASKTDKEIKEQFCDYFDFPVFMDYYILMETTLSTDNHGKNAYYGVYDKQTDKKITISVWDLDATLGQRWSDVYYHSSLMKPEQDYTTYITYNEHGDWNLFRKLRTLNINNFNEAVRYRYQELRNGELSTENICKRFEDAIKRMKNSGAAVREKKRWSGDTDINRLTLDFDGELAFIKDWVTRRMNYLDNTRFKIGELPPLGIEEPKTAGFYMNLSGSSILINAEKVQNINVYTVNGALVRTVRLQPGLNEISDLPKGIYIVGKQKVVVK